MSLPPRLTQAASMVAGLSLLVGAGPAAAAQITAATGIVTVTVDQVARLNVASIGNPEDRPGETCRVTLSFRDDQGRQVGIGDPENMPPGRAVFLDLSPEALPNPNERPGGGVGLRGVATAVCPSAAGLRQLRLTLEVIDLGTGAATVVVGNPDN